MIATVPETDATADAVLIERSLQVPEAFAAVFDRHYDEVHGYVARRLGASPADDVAAETFGIAFGRRRRYDLSQPSARPWLYGIAANLIARHHRAEKRRYRALARAADRDAVASHADSADGRVDAEALRGRLAAALLDIARRDREVLLLVAWAQLSCEEAAHALGVPAGTARSRLHRAGLTEHGDVYAIFSGMLGDNILPPELEAAIFRAIKRLPGVTERRIEFRGRPAFAIALTENALRQELMLDAETFVYLGQRSTTAKGHRVVVERVRTAIVDAPGRH